MPLIKCPECGREISDKANTCPGCGAPSATFAIPAAVAPDPSPPAETSTPSVPVGDLKPTPATAAPLTKGDTDYRGFLGFFRKHWNGDYSLGRSYWLNSLLVSLFAPGLGLVLFPVVADRPARYTSAAALLVTAVSYVAWVWAVRGTWVSATKHTLAGGKHGRAVKALIILGALRTVAVLAQTSDGLVEHWDTMLGKQAGPEYVIRVSPDGKSIVLTGGMNDGAAEALKRALDLAPGVTTVAFDSTGGWIREGGLVGKVITEHKLNTYVERECSSACTLAFLGGRTRAIGPRARVGFHQARTVGSGEEERHLDQSLTRSIYESAGVKNDFTGRVASTPPDKVWYPTASELIAGGVVTTTSEWDAARDELTAKLRASMVANLGDVRLPQDVFNVLLDCEVSGQIAWLNTTGCAYRFDKATKTLAQHLSEQDACVTKAGNVAKAAEIDFACMKAHIPNDWSVFGYMYSKTFAASLEPKHPESQGARRLGSCVASLYLKEVEVLGCKPMNLDATTSEELFSSRCVDAHQRELDRLMPGLVRDCAAYLQQH